MEDDCAEGVPEAACLEASPDAEKPDWMADTEALLKGKAGEGWYVKVFWAKSKKYFKGEMLHYEESSGDYNIFYDGTMVLPCGACAQRANGGARRTFFRNAQRKPSRARAPARRLHERVREREGSHRRVHGG